MLILIKLNMLFTRTVVFLIALICALNALGLRKHKIKVRQVDRRELILRYTNLIDEEVKNVFGEKDGQKKYLSSEEFSNYIQQNDEFDVYNDGLIKENFDLFAKKKGISRSRFLNFLTSFYLEQLIANKEQASSPVLEAALKLWEYTKTKATKHFDRFANGQPVALRQNFLNYYFNENNWYYKIAQSKSDSEDLEEYKEAIERYATYYTDDAQGGIPKKWYEEFLFNHLVLEEKYLIKNNQSEATMRN
jgi:hypothetical protein